MPGIKTLCKVAKLTTEFTFDVILYNLPMNDICINNHLPRGVDNMVSFHKEKMKIRAQAFHKKKS